MATDYYDAAQTGIDSTKQSLLAAIAQYGSQAKQAIQSGQQQLAAQRQSALSSALAASQARGSVPGDTGNTVSAPYDEASSSLGAAGDANDASMAGLAARTGAYMSEIGATIPTLRTQLEGHLATLKAQSDARTQAAQQAADARATSSAQSLANQQMAMARMATQQQAAAAKAAAPPSQPSAAKALSTGFANEQGFVDAVNQANTRNANVPFGNLINSANPEIIGQNAGLPAGLGSAIYNANTAKAQAAADKTQAAAAAKAQSAAGPVNPDLGATQVTKAEIKAVSNTRAYKDAVDAATTARAAGLTSDQLNQQMQAGMTKTYGHDYPKTRDVIVRMYASGQL